MCKRAAAVQLTFNETDLKRHRRLLEAERTSLFVFGDECGKKVTVLSRGKTRSVYAVHSHDDGTLRGILPKLNALILIKYFVDCLAFCTGLEAT